MKLNLLYFLLLFCSSLSFTTPIFSQAGSGTVRGFVYDADSGEPVSFASVYLEGTTMGTATDLDGFYSISKVEGGDYKLICTFIGYDTLRTAITLKEGRLINQNLLLKESSQLLEEVEISADKQEAKTEVKTSTITITSKQITKIPSVGGTPDLAQYLQVLPGITFTGDQGGQLYVRGGSPIQTRVLLDGLTVFNPFHSIGLFSVFETDIIKNVDVMTGGFNAEYGGRISAIVDVQTRDGNKKEFKGAVSASPFLSKLLLEGPIIPLKADGSGASFILTAKHSYLEQSTPIFYDYVNDGNLPYTFTDIYGKMSFNTGNGSKISLYGFNYRDNTNFEEVTKFDWISNGFGAEFNLVPGQSKSIINTKFAYSNYIISQNSDDIRLIDGEEVLFGREGQKSSIGGFDMDVNFSYFLNEGKIKYGINIGGYTTEFDPDINRNTDNDKQNTTDLSAYFVYNKTFNEKFVFEPSVRFTYYGALSEGQIEPRLGLKFNVTDNFRLKASGGKYTQSFISTKSDRDVVNLFSGYLTTPDGTLVDSDGNERRSSLQQSWHAILGAEYDITKYFSANVEGYYKTFDLVNINRSAILPGDPTFISENGAAYGADILLKFNSKRWFIWGVYSLGFIERTGLVPILGDEPRKQTYPPHFDRRHNMNFLATYNAGKNEDWELSIRWNLGSGFPFTKTQGFYEEFNPSSITDNYLTDNGDLSIIYDDELNSGRLPSYHRLDISVKKTFYFGDRMELEALAGLTNVYNRENIFYVDRVTLQRVNQLPILPSVGLTFRF